MNAIQKITISCLLCCGQIIGMRNTISNRTEGASGSNRIETALFAAERRVKRSFQEAPPQQTIFQQFQMPVDDRIRAKVQEITSAFDQWVKHIIRFTDWKSCAQQIMDFILVNNDNGARIQFMKRADYNDFSDYKYNMLQYEIEGITNKCRQYFLALDKRRQLPVSDSMPASTGFDQALYNTIENALKGPSQEELAVIGNELFKKHVEKVVQLNLGLGSHQFFGKPISDIVNSTRPDDSIKYLNAAMDAIAKTQNEINALADPIAAIEKVLPKAGYIYGGPDANDPQYKKFLALKEQARQLKIIRNTYINLGVHFLSRTFNSEDTLKIAPTKANFEKLVQLTRDADKGILSYLFGKSTADKEKELGYFFKQ